MTALHPNVLLLRPAGNVLSGSIAVIERHGSECLFSDPEPDIQVRCSQ